MRITKQNTEKIEARLSEANGRAKRHTFASYRDVESCADMMEARLQKLGIPKSARKGASASITSGGEVKSAYKFKRRATFIHIKRSASGWNLACVWPDEVYPSGEKDSLEITAAQWARAQKNLQDKYNVCWDVEPCPGV